MNHYFSTTFKIRKISSDTIININSNEQLDSEEEEYLYFNTKPKSIFITGDVCSGKSNLSKRIASHWNLLCLDIQELVLAQIHLGQQSKHFEALQQSLSKGIFLPELYHTILNDALKSTFIKNQGYIVSYDPFWDTTTWNLICNFLNSNKPSYIFSLNLPTEEAIERVQLRKQQLESRIKEVKSLLTSIEELLAPKVVSTANEENEAQESEEEIAARQSKQAEAKKKREQLLIELAFANSHINLLSPVNQTPKEFISILSVKNCFQIDAFQTDDEMFFHAIQILRKFCFRTSSTKPEIAAEITEEADIQAKIQEMYSPKQSQWAKYRPVAYYEQNTMVGGLSRYSVLYRGKQYFLSSAEAQFKFLKYPNKYLKQRPEYTDNILIFGNKDKEEHVNLFQQLHQTSRVKPIPLQKFLTSIPVKKDTSNNEKQPSKPELMVDVDAEQTEPYVPAIHKKKCTFVDCFSYNAKNLEDFLTRATPNTKILLLESKPAEEVKEGEEAALKSDPYASFLSDIVPKFEQAGKTMKKFTVSGDVEVDVALLQQQLNPFQYSCIEATNVPKNEANEVDENWDRIGKTKLYCPVNLKKKKILLKGNPDIAIEYKNSVYFFANEEDREDFKKCPEIYCRGVEPTRPIISVVGINAARNEILHFLSQKYGLPILKYDIAFLESFASKHNIMEALTRLEQVAMKPKVEEGAEPTEEDSSKQESELIRDLFSIVANSTQCSNGILMDSFPSTAADLEVLIGLNVVPELVLYTQISVDEYVALNSNSEILAEEVKQNSYKRDKYKRIKREKQEKKLKKPWVEEEQPPEQEEPVFLSKDDILEKTRTYHGNFTEGMDSVVEKLSERKVQVVKMQHSTKRANIATVESLCVNILVERPYLFACKYALSYDAAIEKLRNGSKFLHHNILYEDPVLRPNSAFPIAHPHIFTIQQTIIEREIVPISSISEEEEPPTEEEGELPPKKFEIIKTPPEISYPAIFNHWVLFFQSEQNRRAFLNRPSLYLEYKEYEETTPIKLCVLGNSERAVVVSELLSSQFNLVPISAQSIMEHFMNLEERKQTSLYHKCKELLEQSLNSTLVDQQIHTPSEAVPLLQELTQYRIRSFKASTFGYVLNNIPFHLEHAKQFKELDCVVLVTAPQSSVYRYFESTFLNGLDFSTSNAQPWKLQIEIVKSVTHNKLKKMKYLDLLDTGKPVPISNIGLSDWFIQKRVTNQFLTYCVVSFVTENILVNCKENEKQRQKMVLYKDKVYYFASEEVMNLFPNQKNIWMKTCIKFQHYFPLTLFQSKDSLKKQKKMKIMKTNTILTTLML